MLNKKQYGKLPPKEAESKPWNVSNRTIPIHAERQKKKYQMTTKNGMTVYLQGFTMIDPATGWIEICTVLSACAGLVSNIVELACLSRYPLPS